MSIKLESNDDKLSHEPINSCVHRNHMRKHFSSTHGPTKHDMEHQLIVVIMIIFSSSFSVFAGNNVDFLHVHGRKFKQDIWPTLEDVTQKLRVLAVPVNNKVGVTVVRLLWFVDVSP